jgi:hypothetical protein
MRVAWILCLVLVVMALPLEPAKADDYALARSVVLKYSVYADGGSGWCGPHVKLRMVFSLDSSDAANRDAQLDVMNRLKEPIETNCPTAGEAQLSLFVGDQARGTFTASKTGGWRFSPAPAASAVQPIPTVTPSPSPSPARAPAAGALPASFRKLDLRSDTMINVQEILAPYRDGTKAPESPAVARAINVLQQEDLLHSPQRRPASDLSDRLGNALQLGTRAHEFLPDLAKLSNTLTAGSEAAQRAAVAALRAKATGSKPDEAAQRKFVADAQAAQHETLASAQYKSVKRADATIRVDYTPSAGRTVLTVISPDSSGTPERVSFEGDQTAKPTSDGSALTETADPRPPRHVTEADSRQQHDRILGAWIDQNGNLWTIAGNGDALAVTETYAQGHKVLYTSQWSLGEISGAHSVDNVQDMDDTLPMDVRQALASTYHPPFTIKLEYLRDQDRLQGQWISDRKSVV